MPILEMFCGQYEKCGFLVGELLLCVVERSAKIAILHSI